MCQYCEQDKNGNIKLILLAEEVSLRVEKDEPYIGEYALTVDLEEENVSYSERINYCPMCGKLLSHAIQNLEEGK